MKNNEQTSAKEVASKFIGKWGLIVVSVLVLAGISAADMLEGGALTAVIGMLSTVVMAIIGMLMGITGTQDKEEKPEITIIKELIAQNARQEPMRVNVAKDGSVTVQRGSDLTTMEAGE
jgi:flagellar basal body-associated protein FliL